MILLHETVRYTGKICLQGNSLTKCPIVSALALTHCGMM